MAIAIYWYSYHKPLIAWGCTEVVACAFTIFDVMMNMIFGFLLCSTFAFICTKDNPGSHWVLLVILLCIVLCNCPLCIYLLQLQTVGSIHHCRADNFRNWCSPLNSRTHSPWPRGIYSPWPTTREGWAASQLSFYIKF